MNVLNREKLSVKIKSLVLVSFVAMFAGYAQAATSPGSSPQADNAAAVAPAPGSKFAKLQVGMHSKEVMDLIGPPTDQKSYQTGKAWIPFHFGGDNFRSEYHYKGEGTLTFSAGGLNDMGSEKLIKINVNPQESGYIR